MVMDIDSAQKHSVKLSPPISCAVFFLFSLFAIFLQDVHPQQTSEKVTAVVLRNWPPQYTTNTETGAPDGFAVDVMNRVAKMCGLTVRYTVCNSWPQAFRIMNERRAELSPNMGITEERLRVYDFTTPYETFRISIFVRTDTIDIADVSDLAGKKVGVVIKNQGIVLMRERGDADLEIYNSVAEAFMALLSGNVEAMVYPEPPVLAIVRQSGLDRKIKIVGQPLQEIKRGIAVRKGNPELLQKLDQAVQKMVGTPEYSAIYQKWYGEPVPFWTVSRVVLAMSLLLLSIFLVMIAWRYVSVLKLHTSLAESNQLLDGVLQHTHMIVMYLDPQMNVIWVNRAYAKRWKKDPSYFCGKTIFDFFECDGYREKFQYVVDTGIPFFGENSPVVWREHPEQEPTYWDWSLVPVKDTNGSVIGLVYTLMEVTQRIHDKERLQEEFRLRTTLLDNIPNCIAMIIQKGTHEIVAANKFASDLGAFPGRKCYEACFGWDKRCVFCQAPEMWQTGTTQRAEVENQGKWHDAIWAPLSKDLYIHYIFDITERKQLEEQLQNSRKMESIGRIAGGIAHDFNNILYIISGNTELALEDIPEGSPVKENLDEIQAASLRASTIVGQLLKFSRKTEQKLQAIDVIPVIKETLAFLRPTTPDGIEIRENIPDADIGVLADPVQIRQALVNLFVNAKQAVGASDGTIEVTVTKQHRADQTLGKYRNLPAGDYLVIEVSDNGHGIEPAIIDRIFDPYFTTRDVGAGSGMGLSVVQGIVRSHDGALTVVSDPGCGAKFTLYLPVAEQRPPESPAASERRGSGGRILFVDDEMLIVQMTRKILERLGYNVDSFFDPVEALEAFRSDPDQFDLVITDMTMPQMSGVALAEAVKEQRADIPVVICTGYSPPEDEEQAIAKGITYIMKPVVKKDLDGLIRKLIGS